MSSSSTTDDTGSTVPPSLSDDVAITALVISLIALLVGLSQLLQAILGTAQGYRRCAASVIGPFAKLRRKVFRWTELRVEVKFTTPLITIVTRREVIRAQYDPTADDLYLLDASSVNDEVGSESSRGSRWSWFRRNTSFEDVLQESLHPTPVGTAFARSTIDTSLRSELEQDTSTTKAFSRLEKGHTSMTSIKSRVSRREARNTLPVTWLRLLQDLHVLYTQYWPDDKCSGCTMTTSLSDTDSQPRLTDRNADLLTTYDDGARTCVAVSPVEDIWEFMPSDVLRPLAKSTVGNVIVLAIRLGMQWRTLDRNRSQMTADGSDYTMSSSDINGLGLVLRFHVAQQPKHHSLIIPSRAADKLMCGIVPGDPTLVKQDFSLISQDRKLVDLWERDGVYARLGLEERISSKLKEQDRWTTHNEVITLLTAFLPLPGSHLRSFYFTGWKPRQYSIFHFFEPRLALLERLRKDPLARNGYSPRSWILKDLEALAQSEDFRHDFFNGYVAKDLYQPGNDQRTAKLVQFCQAIFARTTEFFVDRAYGTGLPDKTTWYLQLVAAHTRLSAFTNSSPEGYVPLTQAEILRQHQPLLEREGIETAYFADHLWRQAQRYVDGLKHREYGIVAYMQQRGILVSPDDIVSDWWVLMLRGIAWDLSCTWIPNPGEPVISSYYYDETPVWIT